MIKQEIILEQQEKLSISSPRPFKDKQWLTIYELSNFFKCYENNMIDKLVYYGIYDLGAVTNKGINVRAGMIRDGISYWRLDYFVKNYDKYNKSIGADKKPSNKGRIPITNDYGRNGPVKQFSKKKIDGINKRKMRKM